MLIVTKVDGEIQYLSNQPQDLPSILPVLGEVASVHHVSDQALQGEQEFDESGQPKPLPIRTYEFNDGVVTVKDAEGEVVGTVVAELIPIPQ